MSVIQEYVDQLRELEQDYNQRQGQLTQLQTDAQELCTTIDSLKEQGKLLDQVRMLLQKVANSARQTACERLEDTVTDALKYVFGSDFKFMIELNETKGRSEAEFYIESVYDGESVKTKLADARGGGVVDIVTIALRVALVQIYNNPVIQGPIVLDEPGKHVSEDYTMKLAQFLKQINQTFDRQIIISTHQPDIANIADTSHYVEHKGGKSVVTKQ